MPSVRNHAIGNCQYATASDALGQQLWAQAWQVQNYASIRPGWTITVTGLLATTPAGGNFQLDYELHFETADQAAADALWIEFNDHTTTNSTDDTETYGPD
jgi:hypothetical protein